MGTRDRVLIYGTAAEQWLNEKLGGTFKPVIGLERGGIVAAVGYSNYSPPDDIHMSVYGESFWAVPEFLTAVFYYPFVELNLPRVTCLVAKSNRRSRRLCEHLGFKLEGVHPKAVKGETAISYGLLKENCKWVKAAERQRHPIQRKRLEPRA